MRQRAGEQGHVLAENRFCSPPQSISSRGSATIWLCTRLETSGRRHDPAQEDCPVLRWKSALVDLLSVVHVRKPPVILQGELVHSGALLRHWLRSCTLGVEAIFLQSGLADFGTGCQATLVSDKQGVVDGTARQGLGVAKHIHVRHRPLGNRASLTCARCIRPRNALGQCGDVLADFSRCAQSVGKACRPSRRGEGTQRDRLISAMSPLLR